LSLFTALAINLSRRYGRQKPVDFTGALKKPGRILCFPAQDDGELLCAIPAIRALRKHYRDSLLTLLIDEDKRGLWHFDNEVDEVIDFRPRLVKGLASKESRRLKRIFRQRRFDLLLDLNYRPLENLSYLFFRSGIEVRYGQETGRDYPFKNFIIKAGTLSADEPTRSLDIIKPLGAQVSGHHPAWPKLVGLEGKREFRERLKEEGLKKGQAVLALDGSHWKKKNFEKTLRALTKNPHLKLIVINPAEKTPEQDLSGQTVMNSPSSAETAEALSQTRGFIGSKNDVFSIAYMLKVPSLITAKPHSRGLPLAGELLQIRHDKMPFEISDQELAVFLQKIF
jgi:ADP-heptose:LPS heptosyltransferase